MRSPWCRPFYAAISAIERLAAASYPTRIERQSSRRIAKNFGAAAREPDSELSCGGIPKLSILGVVSDRRTAKRPHPNRAARHPSVAARYTEMNVKVSLTFRPNSPLSSAVEKPFKRRGIVRHQSY
jgi:hypothetical protein